MSTQWQQFLQQQPAPQPLSDGDSWFCDLSDWSILSVSDGNPKQFLQGQITCDLNSFADNSSTLGARCNAKGRMMSNFRLLPNGTGYWLVMHHSIIDANVTDLGKYAVFFRSTLRNEQEQLAGIGLAGPQARQWLEQQGIALPARDQRTELLGGQLVCVDEHSPRYQLWLPLESACQQWAALAGTLPRNPQSRWTLADIRQGIAWVDSDSLEQYTPHQFNLQALGAISFRKGCYTGQEIVARMQHLGKSKSRLYRLQCEALPEQTPCSISDETGAAVGELVSFAPSERGGELLAVVRNDAIENKKLAFGANKVLTVAELPYAITHREHLEQRT
ncbi:YgfZ/GcvT domain-containing protein [Aestuariirhabdus litorea]|uniref:Folate-binding protein n=1 Tax=Aestuariirhabdus litorea TaxID=2528527 RepID=A0A3P3VWS2_9GAMM|nr:folate-binding protein YgfZ [Aestuariirhabdus litorea]RRJ85163.1 folate-binding protein [Aestuariirhabdus litorea]RWW98385.1 folate-binding protein [Endozoicomonadaceae bacterium GTF-13]